MTQQLLDYCGLCELRSSVAIQKIPMAANARADSVFMPVSYWMALRLLAFVMHNLASIPQRS